MKLSKKYLLGLLIPILLACSFVTPSATTSPTAIATTVSPAATFAPALELDSDSTSTSNMGENPNGNGWVSVSPNRKSIAYWEGAIGSESWDLVLEELVSIEGENNRVILAKGIDINSVKIAWSPDSMQVAYTHSGGITTINVQTRGKSQFTSEHVYEPSWNKHGIAFTVYDPENYVTQVSIWNPETNEVKAFTGGDESHHDPLWSPNGEYLLVTTGDDSIGADTQVYQYDGKLVKTIKNGFLASWSPNGRQIAYAYNNADGTPVGLWILDLKEGNVDYFDIKGHSNEDMVWSPDGTKIAFVSFSGLAGVYYVDLVNNITFKLDGTPYDRSGIADELVFPVWIDANNIMITVRSVDWNVETTEYVALESLNIDSSTVEK